MIKKKKKKKKKPFSVLFNIENESLKAFLALLCISSHTLAYNPNARLAYEYSQHALDFGRIKIICSFNSL